MTGAGPRLLGRGADRLLDNDHRVVITGAGGWIGRATLELLHGTMGQAAFGDRVVAFGSSRRRLELPGGIAIEQRPLAEMRRLNSRPTLVLHLAFLTKDRVDAMSEDDYVRANRELSQIVLDALEPIDTRAVFVASSGAAHFAGDETASGAMRLYGSLKREDEDAFARWAERQARRAVIGRIFAISGRHINKHGVYALSSFILDALARRPIHVRARHQVVRAYVAISELISLVFALLTDGSRGVTRFDTGGEAMELQAVAERVGALLGPVPVERPPLSAGTTDRYVGDAEPYRRLLREHGIRPLGFDEQVLETARFLVEADEAVTCAPGDRPLSRVAVAPDPRPERSAPP